MKKRMPHGRPRRTEAEIDAYLTRRASSATASAMANVLGIPTADVRRRLKDMGLLADGDTGSTAAKYEVHPMWTDAYSDEERREAIWKRQHHMARKALRRVTANA